MTGGKGSPKRLQQKIMLKLKQSGHVRLGWGERNVLAVAGEMG